ncbi:MAG: hypothetical protein OEX02_14885 [Cyclobacteriaceae bacterium]|nr:hypothetical protein [Cyclobacteriaceae bacterium]
MDTSFLYRVDYHASREYRFAVKALFHNGSISPPGETLNITVPSLHLPKVKITEVLKNNGRATIIWSYPHDIADLQGFLVYDNGNRIDTGSINKVRRSFEVNIPEGRQMALSVTATTTSGLESDPSLTYIISR